MKKAKIILLCLFVLAAPLSLLAGPLMLKAGISREKIAMGDTAVISLQLVKDKGVTGDFPEFAGMKETSRLPLCGDSIEMGPIMAVDTVDIGSGREQINYRALVQPFYPGVFNIPGILYFNGTDSIRSNKVILDSEDVDVNMEGTIQPLQGPAELQPEWSDKLPDSVYDFWEHLCRYWYFYVAGLLLLSALIWWIVRYLKQRKTNADKKKLSPYELAVWQLQRLKAKKLWENGRNKEFYSELTDILRTYISQRFGVNAVEMTTTQLKDAINGKEVLLPYAKILEPLLEEADFVKFAKFAPEPEENKQSFNTVAKFVEDTKPQENPEEENDKVKQLKAKRGKSKVKLSRRQREDIARKREVKAEKASKKGGEN